MLIKDIEMNGRAMTDTDDLVYVLISGDFLTNNEDAIPLVKEAPVGFHKIGEKTPGHYVLHIYKRDGTNIERKTE